MRPFAMLQLEYICHSHLRMYSIYRMPYSVGCRICRSTKPINVDVLKAHRACHMCYRHQILLPAIAAANCLTCGRQGRGEGKGRRRAVCVPIILDAYFRHNYLEAGQERIPLAAPLWSLSFVPSPCLSFSPPSSVAFCFHLRLRLGLVSAWHKVDSIDALDV